MSAGGSCNEIFIVPSVPPISDRRNTFDSRSLNSMGKSSVSVGGSSSVYGAIVTGRNVSSDWWSPVVKLTAARKKYVIQGCANRVLVHWSTNSSPKLSDGGSCKHCSGESGLIHGIALEMIK